MTRPQLRPRVPGPRVPTEALPDWMGLGACVGQDPDLFNGPGLDVARALAVCALCTVRAECLDFGLAARTDGVYGGRLLREPKKPGPKPRVTDDTAVRRAVAGDVMVSLSGAELHTAWQALEAQHLSTQAISRALAVAPRTVTRWRADHATGRARRQHRRAS